MEVVMGFDWKAVGEEATQILVAYLRINSSNPPGDERQTAEFWATRLREIGLEPRLFESAPQRVNVVARARGEDNAGPLLLLNHMDVVPADPAGWDCDPFGGEIRNGYLYGRGAIDMKGIGVIQFMALKSLLQSGRPRKRDIIFLAVADEEMGGNKGAGWMVDNHWDEIRPDTVWDEGGCGVSDMVGDKLIFSVAVAEKQLMWVRLTAKGQAGHASLPAGDNSVYILIQTLEGLRAHPFPPRLTAISTEMFKRIGRELTGLKSFALRNVDHPLVWPLVRNALTRQPLTNAMLRNLATPTQLSASEKTNVIPQTAQAMLDLRLLPDENPEAFIETLRRLIADERVTLEVVQPAYPSRPSPFEGHFFAVLDRTLQQHWPGSIVVPMLTPGATDSRFFRQKGVNAYGLEPIVIDQQELAGMHGVNERISLENIRRGVQVAYDILTAFCC
jgi:acetylornithine deacetylase/succinyl-diaminopimelate desuccinylase-like protein